MRLRSRVTTVLTFVIAIVLLPTMTNVMASDLPDAWKPYLWLSWPLTALLATVLAVAEIRKSRNSETEHEITSGMLLPGSLIYESDKEHPNFASWTFFADRGVKPYHFTTSRGGQDTPTISFTARQGEAVGINKSLPTTSGTVSFTYKIGSTDSPGNFVYFAMIPMAENSVDRLGLIELGGNVQADPRNPRSPFRTRYFVPRKYYGDDQWHTNELNFDFTSLDGSFYAIFAARVNEGIEKPGDIDVYVRDVRAWRA